MEKNTMWTQTAGSGSKLRFLPAALGLAVAAAFGLTACEGTTGPDGGNASVGVAFQTASASASGSLTGADVSRSVVPGVRSDIGFSGSNGTLSLRSVHLVVTDFALERAEAECDSAQNEDACEEFQAGPQFLDLPLDAGTAVTVSQEVPAGTYEELEFEVDDLEDDDEDEEHQAEEQLLQEIRSQFSNWPEDASLRVSGSFTPSDTSAAREFTAYFEAEIEVEKEFPSPLVIEEGTTDKTVTVTVDPSVWFTRPDGTVVDLSQFDFESTGRVGEFEIEMENGFTETEFDDD